MTDIRTVPKTATLPYIGSVVGLNDAGAYMLYGTGRIREAVDGYDTLLGMVIGARPAPYDSFAALALLPVLVDGEAREVAPGDTGNHLDQVTGFSVPNKGIYRGILATQKWTWVAPYPALSIASPDNHTSTTLAASPANVASQLDERLNNGTLAALREWAENGAVGDVPTRGTIDEPLRWEPRSKLSEQALNRFNFATDIVQFFTQYANAERFTTTVNGDGSFTIAGNDLGGNILPVVAAGRYKMVPGQTYIVDYEMTLAPGTDNNVLGMIIGFIAHDPSDATPRAELSAGDRLLMVRGNGTLFLYNHDLSELVDNGLTPFGGIGRTFGVGDKVRMIVQVDSLTTGTVEIQVNGVTYATRKLNGIPAGSYFAPGIRFSYTDTAIKISSALMAPEPLDTTLRLFVDPNAAAGGDGSLRRPYKTLAEVETRLQIDAFRASVELHLAAGDHFGRLRFNMTRRRLIRLIGSVTGRSRIIGAVKVTGGWTQIGSTGAWRRPVPGFLSADAASGHLVDVTAGVSESFGFDGTVVLKGRKLLKLIPPNSAYIALPDNAFSIHDDAGSYPSQIVIRPGAGIDPNTREYQVSVVDDTIYAGGDSADLFNTGTIEINHVDCLFAYRASLYVERCFYRLNDVRLEGSYYNGLQQNFAGGVSDGLVVLGTAGDNINAQGSGALPSGEIVSIFRNTVLLGAQNFGDFFGDNLSNHLAVYHRWFFYGLVAMGAGKSCIATSGAIDVDGAFLADSYDAVAQMYGDEGDDLRLMRISNTEFALGNWGVLVTDGGFAAIKRKALLTRCHFRSNRVNSIKTFAGGAGSEISVETIGQTFEGTLPLGGDGDYSEAGGPIIRRALRAAV